MRLQSKLCSGLSLPPGQAAVAAYLLCIPLLAVLIGGIGGHDVARMAQLGLGLVCALVLALDAGWRSVQAGARSATLLGLIALLALASTLHSPATEMAARELAVFAGMVAIALVVARSGDAVLAPSRIAAIASAAYVAVVLLVIGMSYLGGQALNRAELFIGYDNYRFFNHTQTAALPLAVLALTLAPRHHWLRGVAWFSAVAGFALLFALAGRGTLVGIAAGALAIGLMFGRASFPVLRSLALGAVLGLVLFALIFWLIPLAMGLPAGLSADYYGSRLGSVEMRLFLWRIALVYIEQAPWLGIGPMQFADVPTGDAAHPHNIYLQIGAEWGLPMLALLLLSGLLALQRLAAAVRSCPTVRDRDCGVGLVMACVAIGVDGLFSGNFVMPVSQVWIAFTFGWAGAWWAAQQQDKAEAPPKERAAVSLERVLALAFVASQVWLVWSVWPELRQLDSHIQQVMDRVPTPTMNPRFWSHGWF